MDRQLHTLVQRLEARVIASERRERSLRGWLFALVLVGTSLGVGSVVAQPGVSTLHVFSANTPARAGQVNQNFALLQTWIEQKLGTVGQSAVDSQFRIDESGNTYDVWIQGGAATSGDARNLAMLGQDEDSGDKLFLNWAGEYGSGVEVQSNLAVTGNLSFGASTRQMIGLYSTAYGIGVQSGTQYFRTAGNFAWYRGGNHDDRPLNAGGGTSLATLNTAGLEVSGDVTVNANSWASSSWLPQIEKQPYSGNTVAAGGTPNPASGASVGWAVMECRNGQYMCGIAFTHPFNANGTNSEYVTIRCCAL